MFFRRCWTLKFFKDLLVKVIDALAVQVGLLQGLWSSKITSLDCSGPPSWGLGEALGLQVELFGALGNPKLESWTAWILQVDVLERFQASKLRSVERFGPPSGGLWSALGLQVGFLGWILASKMGSMGGFLAS